MRIIVQMALLSMVITLPCHAQELRVKKIVDKEAIIEDVKTAREVHVKQGEEIWDDWKVIEITDSLITIEKEIGPNKRIRGQMPAAASSQEILKRSAK